MNSFIYEVPNGSILGIFLFFRDNFNLFRLLILGWEDVFIDNFIFNLLSFLYKIKGDVEAIVIIDNSKSKLKYKRNFRLLTTLHTVNDYVKDRSALEASGKKVLCNCVS